MQIQQMADSMLSDRSWLPGFRRKIFMQSSESTKYDRRKKEKSHQSDFRIGWKSVEIKKDQIHGAQQRPTSVEVFDGKIERI